MIFFRYEYRLYKNRDIEIKLLKYTFLRETNKGYWIIPESYSNYPECVQDRKKKWIPKKSKSRFAYPEKEKAWVNFRMRTYRRIGILEGQLIASKRVYAKIKEVDNQ